MDTLRTDLASKGLPTDDEACVLHAMFPVEFAALHKKPSAAPVPTAPAKAPAMEVTSVAKPAAPAPQRVTSSSAVRGVPGRFTITVEGKRKDVTVEEIS
jgi:oxaloacetate decarboxylase alpha subunit/pyruvate carboxylase subunit B